ncbi:MAG TPA: HipA domain-containing protein [Nocardioides sp.]|uniref:type II toxin-antitoxin system HipA family toxin n=1 Tax=uncultured Nocardioides sp. TaxID=198441 RepID=UPI002636EDE7|nr:HipA domain-containing protein [uncultured Nocardioides sp.]HRD59407.1 HipA domain-containing protein [Nocardioides sp.]HRI94379.1 HipA domain-containing protein [Nocardioides sp.]HRK44257.1 HipA domain-containing protein [Nocardioides sp.]
MTITSDQGFATPDELYVWVWLPGKTAPVVAGVLARTPGVLDGEPVLAFAYARSYRDNPESISLFAPELPLVAGTMDPTRPGRVTGGEFPAWRGYPSVDERSPLPVASCLRDAAPDAWGRRVINLELANDPNIDLTELTYLLHSGSNRSGALDFQTSATEYVPRGEPASLDQLVHAAELIERGEPIPDDLAAAAGHGTSIGGARPKALLEESGREFIAKFSSTTDTRPVVKAEAVGMLLARRVGIDVPDVKVVRSAGKDVLLVHRFDRTSKSTRLMVVSGLTVLGLRDGQSYYSSYADLARAIRHPGWVDAQAQLHELFTRLVLNVVVGNTDDHLRNHAAFWDGRSLRLTPAYDITPSPRNTMTASHAIGLTAEGQRASQLRVARAAASEFLLSPKAAQQIIDHVLDTTNAEWDEVCDEAQLTKVERDQLWGREIMNGYIFWDDA